MNRRIKENLIGKRFGKLIVESISNDKGNGKKPVVKWLCKCECGNYTKVKKYSLVNGLTVSCGCHKRKHGEKNTKLYSVWQNMKRRCYSKNNKRYKNYGERGITVCDEWKTDFKNFRDWAKASGYKDNLTIERIDVNGNYEPSNCKWIEMYSQADNTTRSVYYLFQGEEKTIRQISNITGLTYGCILHRIQRNQKVNGEYLRRCN